MRVFADCFVLQICLFLCSINCSKGSWLSRKRNIFTDDKWQLLCIPDQHNNFNHPAAGPVLVWMRDPCTKQL